MLKPIVRGIVTMFTQKGVPMGSINRFDILRQNDRLPRRVCRECGRALASSYPDDLCQECKDDAIYKEVKAYVTENDVGEYELAEKFGIPVESIRRWVRLGYMDYKKRK